MRFFLFLLALNFWSHYSHESDIPMDPKLYFDPDDPQWMNWIGQFSKGMSRCQLNTDELNEVRVCTRAQFYGPAGVEAMKRSGELYAEHRNDMMLVLVSGCVFCPSGFGQSEITVKLVQLHPEGSMFTSCYQEWEKVSSVEIRTPFGSTAPIPFIIGAVLSERRCAGLFSTDAIRMQFFSHYLLLENVQCDSPNQLREIPLQKIHTTDYENRALEYVFSAPLDLSRTHRNLRMMQIWGVPPERGQSKQLKLSDIDCGRVMANDIDYIEHRTKDGPITFTDPGDALPVDCAAIRSRYFHFAFAEQKYNRGNGSVDYPLAFIRLVYKDYLFIEMEFASSYMPQNYYCYAIDKKSPRTFRRQIHALSICFPNVLSVVNEFDMDSKGHYHMNAAVECMKLLLEKDAQRQKGKEKWKYAILLQNDDVQIKTNEEMVKRFKWMNGVNDIQYTRIGSTHINFEQDNWSLSHLKLFKNETKNRADLELKKNKGQFSMSLTREFVEWLLIELNVTILLEQLNFYDYAPDEFFVQTLASNEFLEAPGGFTQKCFDKELAPGFTRMVIWVHSVNALCHSGIIRHSICILGLKDLVPHLSGKNPFLFANKMQMGKDVEAIQCWHETMFNRTYLQAPTSERLNKSFISQLPQVLYNEEKRKPNFDVNKFNCRYAFIDEVKQYQELIGEYRDVIRHFKSAEDLPFCIIPTNETAKTEKEQSEEWQQKQRDKENSSRNESNAKDKTEREL